MEIPLQIVLGSTNMYATTCSGTQQSDANSMQRRDSAPCSFAQKPAFTRKSQNVARLAGSVLTVPFTVPVVPILMFGTYIGRVPYLHRLVLIEYQPVFVQ